MRKMYSKSQLIDLIKEQGGGGSKLYKHSVQIGSDQVSSGVIQFSFISASDEPVVEPESFESKLYKAIAPFTVSIPYYDDDLGADCELRYIGDTFYLASDGTTAFNVGDHTHENLYGILVNVNFMTEQTEFKLDARVYEVLGIEDTVTAL